MGNQTEFETRNERRWETRQETSIFNEKGEKQGENTKKNRGKTGKKNRKLQEIQKHDFDEILENAENRNKISTRFREILKTEMRTKTRSSQTSRYDNLRAKTSSWCRPSAATQLQVSELHFLLKKIIKKKKFYINMLTCDMQVIIEQPRLHRVC